MYGSAVIEHHLRYRLRYLFKSNVVFSAWRSALSGLVTFAVVAMVLVWPYQATNPPVSIFASEAHAAEIANDCTASNVPSIFSAWCGTFEGHFFKNGSFSGNFSGLKVTAIFRGTDNSIIPHGKHRWKDISVSLTRYRREMLADGRQMTIEYRNGGKSTYTLQDDGSIKHWWCRNKEKRCLLGSRMALLKRVD